MAERCALCWGGASTAGRLRAQLERHAVALDPLLGSAPAPRNCPGVIGLFLRREGPLVRIRWRKQPLLARRAPGPAEAGVRPPHPLVSDASSPGSGSPSTTAGPALRRWEPRLRPSTRLDRAGPWRRRAAQRGGPEAKETWWLRGAWIASGLVGAERRPVGLLLQPDVQMHESRGICCLIELEVWLLSNQVA